MSETGQPGLAPENVDIANATASFKAFITGDTRPRDEQGRFAPAQAGAADSVQDEETEAALTEGEEAPEADAVDDGTGEDTDAAAAEEAQPEADVPMPVSWSKDDESLWAALPADAKAKIFAREAQRDQAVNSKFQEAANVRRQAEAIAQEAAANRDAYIQQLEAIEASIMPRRPDPAMLNPQSPNYDPDSYHLARAQYEQTAEYLATVRQQRAQAEAQRAAQQSQADAEWRQQVEAEWQPKLLAAVPELASKEKAPAILADLTNYALSHGYDGAALEGATSADVLVLWKAQQFDKQREAAQRMKAQPKPQPKPAAPAIRPGVTQPASLTRQNAVNKTMERLAQTGSIEDGAAMFKLLAKRR